jgi:hypothetical protein
MKIAVSQNRRNITAALVFCLLFGAAKVFACDCALLSTEDAVKKSAFVFSGKVVGSEYRKGIPNSMMDFLEKASGTAVEYETLVLKFRVEKVWKGDAPEELFLLTSRTRNADGTSTVSSCNYEFAGSETYLIYAMGKEEALRTGVCMGTKLLKEAQEDLKILGEGKAPTEKRNTVNAAPLSGEARLLSAPPISLSFANHLFREDCPEFSQLLIKNFAPNGKI